ncbi:MAG: hypothetical protein ACFFD4_18075 [Candidatus Odinarchaeota archaeon]
MTSDESTIEELEKKITYLEQSIDGLRLMVSTKHRQITGLQEKVKELDAANATIEDLRYKLEGTKPNVFAQRAQEFEQAISAKDQQISELTAKVQEFEQAISAKDQQISELTAKAQALESANATIEDLREQNDTLTSRVKTLEEQLTASEKSRVQQVNELTQRARELEQIISLTEHRISELTVVAQALESANGTIEDLREQNDTLTSRVKTLEEQLTASEKSRVQQVNELTQRTRELEQTISLTDQQIRELTVKAQTLETANATIEGLKQHTDTKTATIQALETELNDLKLKLTTAQKIEESVKRLLDGSERGSIYLKLIEIKQEVSLDELTEQLNQPPVLIRRHIQYLADQGFIEFDGKNRTVKLKD